MAELAPTKSGDRVSRTSGVLWGPAKVGKTTFLTSLPGKKLFVMVDPDGDQSLPDHPDIHVLNLYQEEDPVILRYATDKLGSLVRKMEPDSVVFDSLSTFGQITLNEAIRKGIGKGREFDPTLDAPGQAAYGSRTARITDVVNKLLRATASVGAHCWFTSHEDTPETDKKGDIIGITMTMSGKAISNVGLNVSEIWHLRHSDKKWILSIAPNALKKPMGSRIFDVTGNPSFELKFDPTKFTNQPHSIATWFDAWVKGGRKKLPLPK